MKSCEGGRRAFVVAGETAKASGSSEASLDYLVSKQKVAPALGFEYPVRS